VQQQFAERVPGWILNPVEWIAGAALLIFNHATGMSFKDWGEAAWYYVGQHLYVRVMDILDEYQEGFEAGWNSVPDQPLEEGITVG